MTTKCTINKQGNWLSNNPIKTIITAAVFFRVIMALIYQHITIYPDSEGYIHLFELMRTMSLSGYEGQRTLGYPLLIGLAGGEKILIGLYQSILGVASLVILYKTLKKLNISQVWALSATILMSSFFPIIFFEFAILTESLTLFVISLLFYRFISMSYSFRDMLELALYASLLILIKPFYIYLPFILVIAIALKSKSWNKMLKSQIILLFSLTIFLGWSYLNKLNTGVFTPSTYYGFNLAQNCVMFAENTSEEYIEIGDVYAKYRDLNLKESDKEVAMSIWEAEAELQQRTGLSFVEMSTKLYNYSIVTIKLNPLAYLKQVGVSWLDFWKTSMYWEKERIENDYLRTAILFLSYVQRIFFQLVKLIFVLLIPINICRFIKTGKLSNEMVIMVLVVTASVLQALMTYGTNSRFSYPFELLILCAVLLESRVFLKQKS